MMAAAVVSSDDRPQPLLFVAASSCLLVPSRDPGTAPPSHDARGSRDVSNEQHEPQQLKRLGLDSMADVTTTTGDSRGTPVPYPFGKTLHTCA